LDFSDAVSPDGTQGAGRVPLGLKNARVSRKYFCFPRKTGWFCLTLAVPHAKIFSSGGQPVNPAGADKNIG
jgi:hypothetical protein